MNIMTYKNPEKPEQPETLLILKLILNRVSLPAKNIQTTDSIMNFTQISRAKYSSFEWAFWTHASKLVQMRVSQHE